MSRLFLSDEMQNQLSQAHVEDWGVLFQVEGGSFLVKRGASFSVIESSGSIVPGLRKFRVSSPVAEK